MIFVHFTKIFCGTRPEKWQSYNIWSGTSSWSSCRRLVEPIEPLLISLWSDGSAIALHTLHTLHLGWWRQNVGIITAYKPFRIALRLVLLSHASTLMYFQFQSLIFKPLLNLLEIAPCYIPQTCPAVGCKTSKLTSFVQEHNLWMGIKDNVIDSMARYWFISNDNLLLLQGRFSGCSAWGWLCGTWSQSLRWFCKWADFGMSMLKKLLRALAAFDSESVIPAVGSVSPWSLWHEVPCRCVMDSKLSVLMLQAGELLWASVSNIAMRGGWRTLGGWKCPWKSLMTDWSDWPEFTTV